MSRPGTYNFKVSLFHGTSVYHSVKGEIILLDKDDKPVEVQKFNDWVEIGCIIRELTMKHKLKISITDRKGNKVGYKCTHRKKKRMVI